MIIGWLQEREKDLRQYAKTKGVKIRDDKQGIKLYYLDGNVYEVGSWSYIEEIIDTGKVILYDGSEYLPKKIK